jgi:hypothetical protein
MENCGLDDYEVEHLSELSSIWELDLTCNHDVTPRCLTSLRALPHLRKLVVSPFPGVTERGTLALLDTIASFPALERYKSSHISLLSSSSSSSSCSSSSSSIRLSLIDALFSSIV